MIRRRFLGQHFLDSDAIAHRMVSEARITKKDTVFEIGTGLGILTPLLCSKALDVISIESDERLLKDVRPGLADIENLKLRCGDGFMQKDKFSIFVSSLPYSKSRNAIEWLAQTQFSHGVVMVQSEFAEKISAKSPKYRRAVSVIAQYCFEIDTAFEVSRNSFSPPPKVDSVVLRIRQKATLEKQTIQSINRIFSYRRKTISNILKQFGIKHSDDRRVDDLLGDEIVGLARQIEE